LADGSVINGEVVSFTNGIYTLNTANFGEIKVEARNISKIESANYLPSKTSFAPILQENNPVQPQAPYGQVLLENPENAAVVLGLTSNPKLQEMAKNPEILDAAKRNDLQALMQNAEFMEMVNSPELQEAVKKLKK